MLCFEARRRLSNTASARRAAPATAETAPATMGVGAKDLFCSTSAATCETVEVAASQGEGTAAGSGDIKNMGDDIGAVPLAPASSFGRS